MLGDYVKVCACRSACVSDSPFRGKCRGCGAWIKNVSADKAENPDAVINAAEADLENTNYHSLGRLPSRLFGELKSIVAPALHHELARVIERCMPQ
jgi:hypothetical protein